jgi:secretion/DNA translocation related CpaE-like protein
MPRPLLVTDDADLLDDLLRLAAAADAEPDVAPSPGGAAPLWRSAPLVVVGADCAGTLPGILPRRSGLVLVGRDSSDTGLWRNAVAAGAEHVAFLPEAEPWLVTRLADSVGSTAAAGLVVGVIGARGGAGATSLSVALSLAAGRTSRRTLLVDADPYGGGIDLALGAECVSGSRWADLASDGPLSVESLVSSLPRCGEVTVLAWSRESPPAIPAPVVSSVLATARRGSDLVVVDLPRCFGEASLVALDAADVVLEVCPAEFRAAVAGHRIAETVGSYVEDVRLVVRGPAPTGLTAEEVAAAVGLPLFGWLDPEPELERLLDEGEPPGRSGRGPLAAFCSDLLAGLFA